MNATRKTFVVLMGLLMVLSVFMWQPTKAEAAPSPITNARTHYNTHGESIKYFSDGTIRYAEKYTTGEFKVMTRVMGYRVKMTVGGSSATVDYSAGYSTAPYNVRTTGFRTIENTYGDTQYVVYVFDFDQLVTKAREKSATVASRLASGDYDVDFKFDGISEIYLDSTRNNKRIFGPEFTKTATREMYDDYNSKNHLSANSSWGSTYDIPRTIMDTSYDITFTVPRTELPIVDYVSHGISFPDGGSYNSSGNIYYVALNKKVRAYAKYKGQQVDLTQQYLRVGDLVGGADDVDDMILTWNHGTESYSVNSSGNTNFYPAESSGTGKPNAGTTSQIITYFDFKKDGGNWYVQSEARNEANIYEGGEVAEYRNHYTLRPDGLTPDITGLPSSSWRAGDATWTAVVKDSGSGISDVKYYRGSTLIHSYSSSSRVTSYTLPAQTATSTGSYRIVATDNVGNVETQTFDVNIDKVDPTLVVNAATGWNRDNVNISYSAGDFESGLKSVTLPNGTVTSIANGNFNATSSGTYSFTATDNAGNTTTKSVSVLIDKNYPTGTVSQSPTAPTTGDVTLTFNNVVDTGGSGLSYIRRPNGTTTTGSSASQTVSSNGQYYFHAEDNAGNLSIYSIDVTNIDRSEPTANLSQTPTAWTNGNVTLSLTSIADIGTAGLASVTLPNGTVQTTFENKYYNVSDNGTYSFVIRDRAGNETTRTITVSNIERTAPTATLTQTPTGWIDGNVTLTISSISDAGGSGMKSVRLPNGTVETTFSNKTFQVTSNGTYTFTLEDNAGNTSTRSVNVTNIDTTAPTGNLTQTPTSWTNSNVTLNLTGVADSGSGVKNIKLPNGTFVTGTTASQSVSSNGTYSFVIEDNAGNTTTKSITVSNIDTVDPTGTLSQTPTSWTDGDVTLNLTSVSDTGGSGLKNIKLPNGSLVTGTSASQVVTGNGTYSFVIYDNAGNSTTKTITVSNIDKVAPTAIVSADTTAWTDSNVVLTLSGIADTGGSGMKSVKLPNGSVQTTFENKSVTVSANGTYTFTLEDNAGNTSTRSINVTNIDKSAPTGNLSQTPTSWTDGDVTLNLTGVADTGGSGVKSIKQPNGTIVTTATASQVVTGNGTYTFVIEDNAGNTTAKTIVVTNIDKVDPIASTSISPSTWTNGTVNITLSGISDSASGIALVTLPNNTTSTTSDNKVYTVASNGTYTFKIKDVAGNEITKSVTVTNIDKIAPTGDVSQTPTTPTNGNVTLTLNNVGDVGGSGFKQMTLPNGTVISTTIGTQTVTTNGTYTFKIEDNAGNVTTKSITVGNIDKVKPTASLSASTTAWTNQNVTLSLQNVLDAGGSGLDSVTLPDNTVVPAKDLTYVATKNGAYTFKISDNAGNETTLSIVVSNIDTTIPTASLTKSSSAWTNDVVTLNLTSIADSGSGVKKVTLPNGVVETTATDKSFDVTSNGTYTFTIEDNAGNVRTLSITVTNIEKIAPTGNLAQTPTDWTNGNVTLNLTGVADTGGSGFKQITLPNGNVVTTTTASQTVTSNGTYAFTIEDNAGNTRTLSITVTNIERIAPTGNLAQTPTSWTNSNVTLNLTGVADTGGSGLDNIKLPNGTFVTGTSASYVVSTNGTYSFEIYDNAGNKTTKSITVSNIDKILPTGDISQTPTAPTNGDVTLNLTNVSDTGGSGVKNITLPNGTTVTTATASQIVTANGTYSFQITDNAGNVTTKTITVSNIDKTAPVGTLSQTPTTWTSGNVTLNLTGVADSGGSGLKTSGNIEKPDGTFVTGTSASHIVTANGTYTFVIYDNVGNSTEKTITVTNIDKTAPTATFTQTPTAWTNGNVTLNVTGATDSQSGVQGIRLPNNTVVTGTSASFLVSESGDYWFYVIDNVGNELARKMTVTNIDKIAPLLDLQIDTVNTVIKATASDATSGLASITLPDNSTVTTSTTTFKPSTAGTYTFKATDRAGNVTTRSITIENPSLALGVSTTAWTNQNVTITANATAKTYAVSHIILPDGRRVDGANASYAATQNGVYKFQVIDKGGYLQEESVTIGNIDKVNPAGSFTLTPGTSALTIRYTGTDALSGVKQIILPNNNVVASTTPTYSVTKAGSYTATVVDNAGNTQTVTATIASPNVTVKQEIEVWTNVAGYNLVASGTPRYGATLSMQAPSSTTWVNGNSLSVRITKNGMYTFNVNDGGITDTFTVDVKNFDRVDPIVEINEKSNTSSGATANVKVLDFGDKK